MKFLLAAAFCISPVFLSTALGSKYRPVVLWHGLGDRYDSPSIERAIASIQTPHEGIQVYPIRLSEDGSEDQKMTLVGFLNDQVMRSSYSFKCEGF